MILGVLSTAFVLALLLFKVNVLVVLVLATFFVIIENICVSYGLWKYNNTKKYKAFIPYVPNIPIWLYFAWALSIVFVIKMVEIFKRNKWQFKP